tara:strand:- start:23 stop:241 length:219 start_codon:yes stop_codon:yes gene_type:complete
MNLKTAIYNQVLEPKYLKVYMYIEELKRGTSNSIKNIHKEDIVEALSDIILIKEKYGIPYVEDIELLEKYKK